MSRQDISPERSGQAVRVYDRVIERAERALAEAEVKTWERFKQEVDRAAEFEADVADLTRDELLLLKAYVQRDIEDLRRQIQSTRGGVSSWLGLDLSLMEAKIRDLLLSVADRTQVEYVELDHRLHHDAGSYVAGEIACAGMLCCLNCSRMVCLVETTRIEPCHACGNLYFKRITARWPREPEVEQLSS